MLPNFIVIGAARSGTTALHYHLAQHPAIFMSRIKEPNCFAAQNGEFQESGPGMDWVRINSITDRREYEALFDDVRDERAIGESSPRYLTTPGAASRIRAARSEMKLIAVLRHPVDRAFAAYTSHRRDGIETIASFLDAANREDERLRAGSTFGFYHHDGRYRHHLQEYAENVPADQLKVCLYEDFTAAPEGFLAEVFRFLDVDDRFQPDRAQRHNVSGEIANPLLGALWKRSYQLRRALRPLVPKVVRDHAFVRITRDQKRVRLDPESRDHLVARCRDDILRLQEFLQRDLSHWLAPSPR